ncbi:MAG: hypothetical protein LDL11_02405 [Desulfarculus sp.]|nr:hypothetical protein [Desulfarculus sp.]
MSNGAVNLPIVIQQAGDVSRVQEQVQRVGEQQQMAAGAEMVRDQVRTRESVQASQRGAAGARVRAQDRNRQGGGKSGGESRSGRKNQGGSESSEPETGGGLVDVVV